MFLAKVHVMYKESILDPQGEAVKKALHQLNYTEIEGVRMGKYFELFFEKKDPAAVEKRIREICSRLLSNYTMENYTYSIEKVEENVCEQR